MPASRRLLHEGRPVELEAKVFDLVLLLVEHRERALAKQAVIEALWGSRPVSDAALSQLVFKARRAFGDDGRQGRVIRTVYGRGLQWVAAIEAVPDAAAPPPAPDPAPAPARRARRRRTLWCGLGALAAIGLLSLWFVPRSMAPPAPPKQRVAVLPIANGTGDPSLDWTTRGLPGLVATLLSHGHDVDVVDPLEAAQAWSFAPTQGRTRDEHVRFATDADVLVGGQLKRLGPKFYELRLRVDQGTGSPETLVLSGGDPATLGVNAATRLRRALKLDPPASSPFRATPQDAYLAETFARGIDLAMHADWRGAKPYFAVVASGAPDFLPGRFQLAQAQIATDEPQAGDAGLSAVLADARRRTETGIAARVLAAQVTQADHRHEDATALGLAAQAMATARQAKDPEILARVLLASANIHARHKQLAAALDEYRQARALIEQTPLRGLEPLMHNTMAYIADAQGNAAAGIEAARAELAADETLGRERSAIIASYNLAYALYGDGRELEALPLLIRAWNWCAHHDDAALQVATGNLLASLLYDKGVYEEIRPAVDTALRLARSQGNTFMQSRLLDLGAGWTYFSGHPREALAMARGASELADPSEDPSTALDRAVIEAFVAVASDPGALPGIRRRADHLAEALAGSTAARFNATLVRAMAAAASGKRQQARNTLASAEAAVPEGSQDLLRATALQLSLTTGDEALPERLMHDFDLADRSVTADTLRLYIAWSNRRGDAAAARRAQARLAALRQPALTILARTPLASGPRPGGG
ncbi:MAG TPA: winged helix-turn-helix domain-containing protein [Frateuria sp.]|uniref:winged helix-turn-helix domain-containing protein n=1 Tax=Frateuria sp. TaxID=2211372 RepID=UPI002D8101E3|nr:winged helix-turn-helix domain-containing protein [Frateuria sp.]HET6806415.1 winged helix-turn-helix domain-containing protein [Frateuria sp.]